MSIILKKLNNLGHNYRRNSSPYLISVGALRLQDRRTEIKLSNIIALWGKPALECSPADRLLGPLGRSFLQKDIFVKFFSRSSGFLRAAVFFSFLTIPNRPIGVDVKSSHFKFLFQTKA